MQIGYDRANLRSHMLVLRWSQLHTEGTGLFICIRRGSANLVARRLGPAVALHLMRTQAALSLSVARERARRRRNAPGEITFHNRTSPSPRDYGSRET